MTSSGDLNAKPRPDDFYIRKAEIKQHQVNRFLYRFIGEPWQWTDKLTHSMQQWQSYVDRVCLTTWIAYYRGSIVGYYELEQQDNGDVEIVYIGLSSSVICKGLGGYLVSHAVESAWSFETTQRVWLHTCSQDHNNALRNYKSRGFKLYKQTKS